MSIKTLISGYTEMDLDGVASAMAYAELLNYKRQSATPAYFEAYHKECDFVFKTFKLQPLKNGEEIGVWDKVIIVDASEPDWISGRIKIEDVIEVIDHREVNRAAEFKNARIQIEKVGAAATLIAEKFKRENIPISIGSAALLYSAIVSNTVNFKSATTAEKDRQMAEWLLTKFTLPANYVRKMFVYKSDFQKPIREALEEFIAVCEMGGKKVGVVQLEIVEVEKFVADYLTEILKSIEGMKKGKGLDLIFVTIIDVERGFNNFVAEDEEALELVEKILKVKFRGNVARREGIIMRKEIWPLVKKALAASD